MQNKVYIIYNNLNDTLVSQKKKMHRHLNSKPFEKVKTDIEE